MQHTDHGVFVDPHELKSSRAVAVAERTVCPARHLRPAYLSPDSASNAS